jgi:competence protein ComEC
VLESPRLDLRLVPAALTSWAVTASGILWPVGVGIAAACLAVGGVGAVLHWRAGRLDNPNRVVRAAGLGLIGAAVVGAGFGVAISLRAHGVDCHPIVSRFGTVAVVTVTPSESPRSLGSGRLLFRATLQRVGDDESSGRVVVFAPVLGFAGVAAGQPAQFHARISRPTRRDLTVAVLNATGEPTLGAAPPVQRIAHIVRTRFADAARDVLPAGQAAMLPALVLGDTSAVTGTTSKEFRAAGLTHLTAVSGANVTIVCGAVLFCARLVGPRIAVVMAACALVAFVVVVQPTASVLRAAVMGAIALLAVLTSRRRQALPALSATVIVLMIAAPHLAVDVGFALSVSATAALVIVAPIWSQRLVGRGWPKPLADAVCIACAAQLVTAPLVAGISGSLSLVAVVANLTVAPMIAPITVLGTAAAVMSLFWSSGALLLIRFTGPELWWLLHVAHWAAGVPGATVPVPAGVPGVLAVGLAAALTVVLWRWQWFRAALACAVLSLFAWTISGLLVGQGAAALSAVRDTIVW